ncbi:MAG: AAA family ATPase, partial [Chitinophagaceae bacterium]
KLFLEKVNEDLKVHSINNPLFFEGRKSRLRVLKIEDGKIIGIGETANTEDPIFKERLKQIYDTYSSPEEIKSVGDLRVISTAIGWTSNYYAVFKELKDFEKSLKYSTIGRQNKIQLKNYVLIIDEVNRGNVSQIFGELITLIEEDKRTGKEEALTAVLPYSKKPFTIPPNLYIIGTMNTADRSVEALDTALRRRFTFELMEPDSSKIIESPEGINLVKLLDTINSRLEALLSKDHTIGHAWLMKIDTIAKLKAAFKSKILPLLQEFFYNDYAKIGLVLGKAFVTGEKAGNQFAKFDNELAAEYDDKLIYTLTNCDDLKVEDFKSVYE